MKRELCKKRQQTEDEYRLLSGKFPRGLQEVEDGLKKKKNGSEALDPNLLIIVGYMCWSNMPRKALFRPSFTLWIVALDCTNAKEEKKELNDNQLSPSSMYSPKMRWSRLSGNAVERRSLGRFRPYLFCRRTLGFNFSRSRLNWSICR